MTHAVHRLTNRTRFAIWVAASTVLTMTAAPPPLPAQGLSFADALARATLANERILGSAAGVDRAHAELSAARGRRLPEVGVTARTTRIDNEIVIDLDPIRQAMLALHPNVPPSAIPPFTKQVQGESFNNATVSATVPLYSGGRIEAGMRAASAAVDAAEAQQRGTVGEVATDLAQRYFGLQLAIQNRITRQSTRASLARHVENARSLERNGQIARAERLRAEVSAAESERDLQQAISDEQLARLALASTLSTDTAVAPSTALFRVGRLAPVDSFKTLAREHNPALARLVAEQKRAGEGVRAARGELLPSAGLFAMREIYTKDLTILQPKWAAGVQLSVPIFQGERLAKVQGAKAQERQVGLVRERAIRDIEFLVEQRYRQVETARAQLVSLDATRSLAEESLRSQNLAFAAGLATSLDVLDAEQALARVQLGILKAQFDGDVALAGLLEAAGQSTRLPNYINAEAGR